MAGIDLKGNGARLYMVVMKMDETPKKVELFWAVEGPSTTGSNSTALPNRQTFIRTVKQEMLDIIDQFGAVLDNGVEIPE